MTPDTLFAAVYAELRRLAAARVASEPAGHSLDATALVHEAYLKLGDRSFADHRHYVAAAATAMRHILTDHARAKLADKRGGHRTRVPLDDAHKITESPAGLLALDDALTRLAADDPKKAELVELRFFAGLTMPEAAAHLGISLATAERWWQFARAWLYAELSDEP